MRTLLWLDDIRDPYEFSSYWPISGEDLKIVWVKSFKEFIDWISKNGLPTAMSLDHDLSFEHMEDFMEQQLVTPKGQMIEPRYHLFTEGTGYDCAQWVCDYCLDRNVALPVFASHSANIVGRKNIMKLLTNFEKHENK